MTTFILLKVFNGSASLAENKPCFARDLRFELPTSVVPPVEFSKIIDVMKILYGENCVVTFQYQQLPKM